ALLRIDVVTEIVVLAGNALGDDPHERPAVIDHGGAGAAGQRIDGGGNIDRRLAVELGAAEANVFALAPALLLAVHVQGFPPRHAGKAHGVDLAVQGLLATAIDANRLPDAQACARRHPDHGEVVSPVDVDGARIVKPLRWLPHGDAVALEHRLVDVL